MLAQDEKFQPEANLNLQDGEILFHEGETSKEMYIVVKGEIEVFKKTSAGEVVLASLKRGDFVGEMSLLESLPRSATARAKGETKLLAIYPGGFLLKIRRDPTFAFEMLQTLSRRIRRMNENLLSELSRGQKNSPDIEAILESTQYKEKK